MKPLKITETNRKAWNYATQLHQKTSREKLDHAFSDEKYVYFDEFHLKKLRELGIKGQKVIQLCCNNGKELMGLKRLGAKECVGFDISDVAIQEAQQRAEQFNMDIEFVRTDVMEISSEYDSQFDIVYLSVGTLRWIPDLNKFFNTCRRLLKSKGKLYMFEMHPLTEIMNDDRFPEQNPLLVVHSYFNSQPLSDNKSLDYVGHTNNEGLEKYWYIYNFSDILGGLIQNNFKLTYFEEFELDISDVYALLASQEIRLPLSFMLFAEK